MACYIPQVITCSHQVWTSDSLFKLGSQKGLSHYHTVFIQISAQPRISAHLKSLSLPIISQVLFQSQYYYYHYYY